MKLVALKLTFHATPGAHPDFAEAESILMAHTAAMGAEAAIGSNDLVRTDLKCRRVGDVDEITAEFSAAGEKEPTQ